MNGKRTLSVMIVSCLVLATSVASASAAIKPQKSIAGIALEMTAAEVIDKKGKPDRDAVVEAEIFGEQRVMRYGRTKVFFAGTRAKSPVILVRSKDRGQRTNGGSGVGSTQEELLEEFSRMTCETEFGFRHCYLGKFEPGKRVTDFAINKRSGKASSVTVAIVVD